MKIDNRMLNQLAAAGAELNKVVGEDLYDVRIRSNDEAFFLYENWFCELKEDTDPIVQAVVAPAAAIFGTIICPPIQAWGQVKPDLPTNL